MLQVPLSFSLVVFVSDASSFLTWLLRGVAQHHPRGSEARLSACWQCNGLPVPHEAVQLGKSVPGKQGHGNRYVPPVGEARSCCSSVRKARKRLPKALSQKTVFGPEASTSISFLLKSP